MKKIFTVILFLTAMIRSAVAQESNMAEVMRSNGKIYVVVTVAAIVMMGILIYLVMIDRKIKMLENKLKNKQ
jgi:hypothetical protein